VSFVLIVFTVAEQSLSLYLFCRRYNIMDNMLRMMEKYANNLEEVIGERTRQLIEEKKKADTLLYRMLPASVS
jgi:C4-dicarboxylate-specific signal transduction histidine kinase